MIPKVNRFIYYYWAENDGALLQSIGESREFHEDLSLSTEEKQRIERNTRLCFMLQDYEFILESYGTINFFKEYGDMVSRLPKLKEYLKETGNHDVVANINKTLEFYKANKGQFELLNSLDYDSEYDAVYEELEKNCDTDMRLDYAIDSMAFKVRTNPGVYCVDEEGLPFDPDFNGEIESTHNGELKKYTFKHGKIEGSCIHYYSKGQPRIEYFHSSHTNSEIVRRWYKNGQVETEKTNSGHRVYYENGQLKVEKDENGFRKWDENGKLIESANTKN